jgi:hypothetical protein
MRESFQRAGRNSSNDVRGLFLLGCRETLVALKRSLKAGVIGLCAAAIRESTMEIL